METAGIILLGIVAGVFSGLLGIGGGTVVVPALFEYRGALRRRQLRRLAPDLHLAGQHSSAAAQLVSDAIATQCVRALDRVMAAGPAMAKELREPVYRWLANFAGFRGKQKALRREFEEYLERKVARDLL